MTDPDRFSRSDPLFRAEALQHRATRSVSGDVVRAAPRWVTGSFYALLGLVVVAVIAASVVQIPRKARGLLVVDAEGRGVLLVSAAYVGDLEDTQTLDVEGRPTQILNMVHEKATPRLIERHYGADVTEPTTVLMVSARPENRSTSVSVVLAREPLAVALIPGLRALLGGDGG